MDLDANDDDISFDQVLQALANPAKKRDPRAVRLAAVTSALIEVIGAANCSASKMYAKAMAALEGTLTSEQQQAATAATVESLSTQAALLELLNATVPHVHSPAILNATLPLTSRVLRAVVSYVQAISGGDQQTAAVMETKDELGGATSLLKWACRATSCVLCHINSAADGQVARQLFRGTLLALLRDRRPKVRRAAQDGILTILLAKETGASGGSGGGHPIIATTMTSYIHSELKQVAKLSSNPDVDSFNHLLHLAPLMERSILHLNYAKLGADIMELLAVLVSVQDSFAASSDFVATTKVQDVAPKIMTMTSLLSIVTHMLEDASHPKRANFLNEFASRVLASLLQVKVSLVFRHGAANFQVLGQAKVQFGQTVLASCHRILDTNQELACKLLPLSIQVLLLLSRPTDEAPDDTTVADNLLVGLTQLFRTDIPPLMEANPASLDSCLHELLDHTEQVMLPAFKATWSVGLKALSVLLQTVHSNIPVQESVDKMIQLRNEVLSGSASQQVIEDAFSTLVQGVGIETCWGWIRFQSDSRQSGGVSVDRSWIVSALKSAAHSVQPVAPRLAFFQSEVLGMARACDKLAATSPKHHRIHRAMVIDLWSLFPCFCKQPSDIAAALPSLTTTLMRAMDDKRYPELVSIICRGLVVVSSQEALNATDADTKAMEAAATKLLPVLFKFVTEASASKTPDSMDVDSTSDAPDQSKDGQLIRVVTDAASALAGVAPTQFLHSLFQKLMHRLLGEIQTKGGDLEKISAYLSLCESLVTSEVLEETNLSFLYRALKPLLRTDEYGPRVQKRAYKVLAEICEHHHSFVADAGRLKELAGLLSGAIMTSQVAARYMRLKCLKLIMEGFEEDQKDHLAEFSKVVGEVLLCLKDSNAKSRDAAYQFLLTLASRDSIANVLQMVTAGLGAETPHMRSAAVMALSRLVFEYAWNDPEFHALLPSLLSTVLVLINEDSREVIKSVVGFIRISVSAIPPEQLSPLLPELVGNLLTYHKKKDRSRAKIKIIIKKLVKMFGYETLMPLVPQSETRLLTHMRKLEERQKRKKAADREARQRDSADFDEMVDSDEEDSDDGRTFMSGMTGFSRLTGRAGEKSAAGKSMASRTGKLKSVASTKASASQRSSRAVRLPNEKDGQVVDMLGTEMSKRVHFAEENAEDSDSDSIAMEFDDDGKLVIRDEDEAKQAPVVSDASAALQGRNKKRRKVSRDEQSRSSKRSVGAAYKSKKAGGDVKKKGQKFEPYAFMPLDGRSYSKKNRRSAVEQMSTVVRGNGKRKRSKN